VPGFKRFAVTLMAAGNKGMRAYVPGHPVGKPQLDAGARGELERSELVPPRQVGTRALEPQTKGRCRTGTEREAKSDSEGEVLMLRGVHDLRGGGDQRRDERRPPPPRRP